MCVLLCLGTQTLHLLEMAEMSRFGASPKSRPGSGSNKCASLFFSFVPARAIA